MSEREIRTMRLLSRLERGEVTVVEVATSLGRSTRQVYRLRRRLATLGPAGLVHGNRGKRSSRRTPEEVTQKVVTLRRGKYAGFNDHHFAEKLASDEGVDLSRETVRRISRAANIASPRKRRRSKRRRRRERSPQAGLMIQWDGSEHAWLGDRGPRLVLMGAVDDATGELLAGAHFCEAEGTVGYLKLIRGILATKGIPRQIYQDRHGSLRRNDDKWSLEEELAGKREATHVKLALNALSIDSIHASSPQGKGRIERVWGTLQDRLVSELRLAGATTQGQANKVLERFRIEYNRRFAVAPADPSPAWRRAPKDRLDLLECCALQYARKVRPNNTVRFAGRVIDLPKRLGNLAGKGVLVKHLLNGRIHVIHDGECIAMATDGPRPSKPQGGPRTLLGLRKRQRRMDERKQTE